MDTTGIKQRTPMHGHHQRKQRSAQRTHVGPTTPMPQPDQLAGAPAEVLEALETWHSLIAGERDQARKAAAANADADQASADYRAKVREALAAGGDPSKIKDTTEQHKASALAHLEFHNDARNERTKLGHRLGPMLEAAAPGLFADAEERIERSAASVRGSLTAIREAWSAYSTEFEIRRWLSHVALDGGSVGAFHGASPLPKAVAVALATLEHAINEVDRLGSDEQQVREYREANPA